MSAVHPRIVGLTGTPDQARDVACANEVFYAKAETEGANDGGTDYSVDHSAFSYLMGPDGA